MTKRIYCRKILYYYDIILWESIDDEKNILWENIELLLYYIVGKHR